MPEHHHLTMPAQHWHLTPTGIEFENDDVTALIKLSPEQRKALGERLTEAKPRMMQAVGVVSKQPIGSPHPEDDGCAGSGCIPVEVMS